MSTILKEGLQQLGCCTDDTILSQFSIYQSFLIEYNEKVNLTAITDPDEIVIKHFLDSVTPVSLGCIKKGEKVIDVGCGAGFPSVPIQIVEPSLSLVLLDSLDKRLTFLKELCQKLALDHVDFVHARAEDGAKDKKLREQFDVAVSRAVANMRVLCEYCLPYVKVGGRFIALKGPGAEQEVAESEHALSVLGGEIEAIHEVCVPFSDLQHRIVVVKKVRQTPPAYPRKAGKPAKNPL